MLGLKCRGNLFPLLSMFSYRHFRPSINIDNIFVVDFQRYIERKYLDILGPTLLLRPFCRSVFRHSWHKILYALVRDPLDRKYINLAACATGGDAARGQWKHVSGPQYTATWIYRKELPVPSASWWPPRTRGGEGICSPTTATEHNLI